MSEYIPISLVIPNLNSGEALDRCISSVLNQNYPNLQLIMADGGSTDESRSIMENYRSEIDVLISEPDKGQADALNKGFQKATGELYGWLCADDELLPGALNHVNERFQEDGDTAVLTGACERVFQDGGRFVVNADPDAWAKIGIQNIIEQPSTFWRSDLHKRLGGLDLSYHLGFDWDLWARMKESGAKISTTDKVLSRYYFSESNKCGTAGNLFMEEAFRLVQKYGPLKGGLAHLYRFIYLNFDLKGCLDKPPSSSRIRYHAYRMTKAAFTLLSGRRAMSMYNWHFASLQQRGMKWW